VVFQHVACETGMTTNPPVERRARQRMAIPYPARVRGINDQGQQFREDTILDNISMGGMYLQLSQCLVPGSQVTVAVRLSINPSGEEPAPRLAAHGEVLRAEVQSNGRCGIAVQFKSRRIL
jgi:PilZ domain